MKALIRSVLALLMVVICGYVVAAGVGAFMRGPMADVPAGEPSVEIGLVSGPIHFDFLLPLTPETRSTFSFVPVPLDHPNAEWLVVGWGARGFYTTVGGYSDLSMKSVFDGITGDTSVVRFDVVGALPEDVIDHRLTLSDAQYAVLIDGILGSVADQTAPLALDGFGPTDVFFHGAGRFNILRTCNVWIGEMLRGAGVPFGVWTPIPLSVSASLRHFHRD